MARVEFLCLANSWKHGGRCVAGLRTDGGGWVRPVGNQGDGTLVRPTWFLDDGSEAALLDVIEVELTVARPEPHQPENWVLGAGGWVLKRRESGGQALPLLTSALEAGPTVIENRGSSVSYALLRLRPAKSSLALVEPQSVGWIVREKDNGNRQYRCHFTVGGCSYNLPMTDPKMVSALGHLPLGSHAAAAGGVGPGSRVFLTISLPEPWEKTGDCYKLVAGVVVV